MHAAQASRVILIFSKLIYIFHASTLTAAEDYWQRVDYEYSGFYESLPGNTEWTLNHSRGPDDRWVVALTISGYWFNSTTGLIADADAYNHWCSTGSTSQCTLVANVNTTLDATAKFLRNTCVHDRLPPHSRHRRCYHRTLYLWLWMHPPTMVSNAQGMGF